MTQLEKEVIATLSGRTTRIVDGGQCADEMVPALSASEIATAAKQAPWLTLDVYDDEGGFRGHVEASPEDTRASLVRKFAEEHDLEPGREWLFCRQHTHIVVRAFDVGSPNGD